MAEHGALINSHTQYKYIDPTTKKETTTDTPPQASGGFFGVGSSTPSSTAYREDTYEDGTKIVFAHDPTSGDWKQVNVSVDPQIRAQYEKAHPPAKPPSPQKPLLLNGTAYTEDPNNPGTLIPMPGAPAPGTPRPGTDASLINAASRQQQVQNTGDYDEGRLKYLNGELTRQNLLAEANLKHQQLQAMVALHQIDQPEADARLARWKAGVEAAQQEKQLAISQQNANTSAGQLGVARGGLGVTQQNADTQREAVVQQASANAVDQTIRLLGQYTKVGPGFGAQFAAGLNTLSRGGGALNITPDAFMGAPVPDLNAIRTQAVNDAIDRLKGGAGAMAPATAAAVNQTSVPGPVAPAAVPPPPPPAAPAIPTSQIIGAAQTAGIIPGAPPAPPPVVPPYTGPVGQGGPGAPPAY